MRMKIKLKDLENEMNTLDLDAALLRRMLIKKDIAG